MTTDLLIIFVKNPELGKVKTRLAATIGNERALDIYKQLLKKTHAITYSLNCDKIIYYTPEIVTDDLWNDGNYQKGKQSEGDLGDRMLAAFSSAFKNNYQQVCIIGSDCYELKTEHISNAFNLLNYHDVVVGPSSDGGYYLLGMKKLHHSLFRNTPWSTDQVLPTTLTTIRERQLSFSLLNTLRDIDREEDLVTMNINPAAL